MDVEIFAKCRGVARESAEGEKKQRQKDGDGCRVQDAGEQDKGGEEVQEGQRLGWWW